MREFDFVFEVGLMMEEVDDFFCIVKDKFPETSIVKVEKEAGSISHDELVDYDLRVISKYTKMKKSGENYIGLCPLHKEITPSFTYNPALRIFHCFGCNEGGAVKKLLYLLRKQNVAKQHEYPAVSDCTFGLAIDCLKAGRRVARSSWNGTGMWLKLQVADISRSTLPYIYIKTVDGSLVPWVASQTDILADDWIVLA